MRANEVEGIIHDLLNLNDWKNPLNHIWLNNKFEINLLKGKITYSGEDDLSDFYKDKMKWFAEKVKKLKGNLKDFGRVNIVVYGTKEKIEIIYKGKKFEKERIYEGGEKDIKQFREGMKDLKAEEVRY